MIRRVKQARKRFAGNADVLLLSIYRLIGLFPLCWKRSRTGELSAVSSPPLGALATVIVLIFNACRTYNIYYASSSGMEYTLLFIKNISFSLTMLAITFSAWLHCSKYEAYLKILAEVDVCLQWKGPSKCRDRCITITGVVLLFLVIAVLFVNGPKTMKITFMIRFVKEVYLLSFAFLVMHLVYGLEARFKRLNSIIIRVNPLQSGAEKIKEVRVLHSQLAEAAAILRIAVAPPVLALLMHVTLIIACALDFIVRGFDSRPTWVLMSMSLNIVTGIFRFLALYISADAARNEREKTVMITIGLYHRYCVKTLPIGLERNFIHALDKLWFQLMQHDMSFNMAGFFVMTVPHLGVLVNAITTYFLLLLSANTEGYNGL